MTAYNKSEVSATLSYQILEANILGTLYITQEGRTQRGEAAVVGDMTSQQLITKLQTDYPFTITIAISNATIQAVNGREYYTLSVVWPYEGGHDDVDTLWGKNAATFKASNPNSPSITLKIQIVITQNAV